LEEEEKGLFWESYMGASFRIMELIIQWMESKYDPAAEHSQYLCANAAQIR
jgi:hypothetical protein